MIAHTDIYNIYFDGSIHSVVMEWTGYATSTQFREGTELMLETLVLNKASKVLAEIREMTIIGMEDQQWLQNDFLPRAINAGFKAIAIIRPESYFNKVAVETVSYKIDSEKLMIRFFDKSEEARQWLHAIEGKNT